MKQMILFLMICRCFKFMCLLWFCQDINLIIFVPRMNQINLTMHNEPDILCHLQDRRFCGHVHMMLIFPDRSVIEIEFFNELGVVCLVVQLKICAVFEIVKGHLAPGNALFRVSLRRQQNERIGWRNNRVKHVSVH